MNATTLGSKGPLAQVIHECMIHYDTGNTCCRHSSYHASGFGCVSFTGAPTSTKMQCCPVDVTCTVMLLLRRRESAW